MGLSRFSGLWVFLVLALLLTVNIQFIDQTKPVAETDANASTAGQKQQSTVGPDQMQWKGKIPDYQLLIEQNGNASANFDDISGHWAETSVSLIKSIGLCQGYPDGSFRPDEALTRLEAISLLMQLGDMPDETRPDQVEEEQMAMIPAWGQSAVKKAARLGLITLDDFEPSLPIDRGSLAGWLVKITGIKSAQSQDYPFKDAEGFSAELAESVNCLYQQGIIKGYPDQRFHPQKTISRAEMMVILTRLLGVADPIRLSILSVNDFHGSLTESGSNPGAAKLAAYIGNARERNLEGTIILSGGDMMQGSIDSNLLDGEPVIDMMNAIGFDAMAIGNHEFDWGVETLQKRAQQASFPFLTCNITERKTGQPLPFTKPCIIVEKAGVKIGIIGFTTPETASKVIPSIIDDYEISEPTAIVNSLAAELRQARAQIIIVVGHAGGFLSGDGTWQGEAALMARSLQGVDVLVTAHTHQKYAANLNGMAVVQAAYNGRAVAEVDLDYSTAEQKVCLANLNVIDLKGLNLSEDAAVKAKIEKNNEKIGAIKDRVIGQNQQDLLHDKSMLSPLGQWFTDKLRQAAEADIAFMNGGALKADIPAGAITIGKMWEVLPFENTLCTVSMTGTQIREVLQYGIQNEQHGMIQYSGLGIQYHRCPETGQHLVNVTLSDGTPLQDEKTYRVAINDFLAEGGDGFIMFRQYAELINTQEPIREMIIKAIEKEQTLDFTADDRFQLINN